jgi:hypothetical protein
VFGREKLKRKIEEMNIDKNIDFLKKKEFLEEKLI